MPLFKPKPPDVSELKSKGSVKGLVRALSYPWDGAVCRAAARALPDFQNCSEFSDQGVVEELAGAMMLDPEIRSAAAEALASLGSSCSHPEAREALLEAVQSPDQELRAAVCEAIGKKGKPDFVEPLAAIGSPAAVDALLGLLDPSRAGQETVDSVVAALGELAVGAPDQQAREKARQALVVLAPDS